MTVIKTKLSLSLFSGYYMAKTILNFIWHEREHYCVSIRPIAFLLEQSERNNVMGRTRAQ